MKFNPYYYPFEEHKSSITYPNMPSIGGRIVCDVFLEELESISHSAEMVTLGYEANENDRIILPDTIHQIRLKKCQVQAGSQLYSYFINVIRNCEGSWLNIADLNRKNHEGKPIHPVSKYLIECSNLAECVFAVLGKTIVVREMYSRRYKIANGIRTNEIEYNKRTYLEFIKL